MVKSRTNDSGIGRKKKRGRKEIVDGIKTG